MIRVLQKPTIDWIRRLIIVFGIVAGAFGWSLNFAVWIMGSLLFVWLVLSGIHEFLTK